MTEVIKLKAQLRDPNDNVRAKKLRLANKVPAIICGGEYPTVSILLDAFEIKKSLVGEGFFTRGLILDVNGQWNEVVVKAIQYHPVTDDVIHIDFLRKYTGETQNLIHNSIAAELARGRK